jgi:hypothetical protein
MHRARASRWLVQRQVCGEDTAHRRRLALRACARGDERHAMGSLRGGARHVEPGWRSHCALGVNQVSGAGITRYDAPDLAGHHNERERPLARADGRVYPRTGRSGRTHKAKPVRPMPGNSALQRCDDLTGEESSSSKEQNCKIDDRLARQRDAYWADRGVAAPSSGPLKGPELGVRYFFCVSRAAAPARPAVPNWPAPASPCPPAAGSASASASRSPRQSPHPARASVTPSGSRWIPSGC